MTVSGSPGHIQCCNSVIKMQRYIAGQMQNPWTTFGNKIVRKYLQRRCYIVLTTRKQANVMYSRNEDSDQNPRMRRLI